MPVWAPAHPFEFGVNLPDSTFNHMAFPDNPGAAAISALAKGLLAIQTHPGRQAAAAKPAKQTYGVDEEGNVIPDDGVGEEDCGPEG